jgi:hypothetical protein
MRPVRHVRRRSLSIFGSLLIVAGLVPAAAVASTSGVVISEFRTRGPDGGNDEFVELRNAGAAAVDISGWLLQGCASGTPGNPSTRATVNAGVVLGPGQSYLFANITAPGYSGSVTPDQTYGTGITDFAAANFAGIRLVAGSTVVDGVGSPNSPCREGTGFTTPGTNTDNSFERIGGTQDTDDNVTDFVGPKAGNPQNFGPTGGDAAPTVTDTDPDSNAKDVPRNANISVTFSEPVTTSAAAFSISCDVSGPHTFAFSGGPTTYTLDPDADFAQADTCTVVIDNVGVADTDGDDPPDNMAADYTFSFSTAGAVVRIHEIQGASHISPYRDQLVSGVVGVVTAKRSNGFYMQDPNPDSVEATSEGVFVFTTSAPTVNVADAVRVSGRVTEFRPGGSSSTNLTITEITSPTVTVDSSGNPLPSTTIVGTAGRMPPGTVIEDDATASVETSGVFDPAADGIDFYESLEHMRLQVNNPVTVGPRANTFGELFVLADDGAGASVRTVRGGVLARDVDSAPLGDYRTGDFNPERLQLDDAIVAGSTPAANVGDHFSGPAVGILDYDFGNFELNLTSALTTVSGGLARESTVPQGPKEVSIATYNVENLDANEPQSKFDTLAGQIIGNLRSPDVLALEEIQDNNGARNDSVVDANLTLDRLVASIQAAGGPAYEWRQINPVDDQDGGEPGGNIRVAFLFRTDRGVEFIDRPGGDSVTPTTVVAHPSGPQLSFSPGRVSPAHTAWNASRKPLAAEFKIRNRTFFMIANHFSSKSGDQPLFGRFQPPGRSSETQRHQQAQLVNDFVDSILAVDPNAHIVVLGDINDFHFSQTVDILKGGVLNDLVDTLPLAEQYSYDFEGNSQVLDHILVSNATLRVPFVFDAVHANSEFADQASDHDPNIVRIAFNSPPRT